MDLEIYHLDNQNELGPGEKTQLVPHLQTVNFGIGQIEITAVISGYDFSDVSITKSGYSFGNIITFSKSRSRSVGVSPVAKFLQLFFLNSN